MLENENKFYKKDTEMLDTMVGYAGGIGFACTFRSSFGGLYNFVDLYPEYVLVSLGASALEVLIKKDSLKEDTITIHSDIFNTGFIIGREGRNIKGVLQSLKATYPETKARRINVVNEFDPNVIMNKMIDFTTYLTTVDLNDRRKAVCVK